MFNSLLANIQSKLYELAFVSILLKGLVYSLTVSDAIVLLGLVAAIGYKSFIDAKKIEKNQNLENKVQELSNKVDSLMMVSNLRKMGQPMSNNGSLNGLGGDFGRIK